MALLTTEELAAAMNKTFDAGETAQAQFFIDAATALIEDYCDTSFEAEQTVTETFQADYGGLIRFTKMPVTQVSTVVVDGSVYTDWSWDLKDTVYGFSANAVADITYTYGYAAIPAAVKHVATFVAMRGMYNPVGIRQLTVGAISETYPGAGGEAGALWLSSWEKKVLDEFVETSYTLHLGPYNPDWRNTLPLL